MLEARDVNLDYGQRRILQDISFSVGQGDFLVIIGPNGVGKTSLLRLLAGLERPTSGRVTLDGRPVDGYPRRRLARTLAYVQQTPAMDFPFTVKQTVLMGRTPHLGLLAMEGRQDRRIAAEAMAFTQVEHLADRLLAQLSGGERQRVLLARALCQEPRVILLDEPTSALDPAHQLKIMDLMERLRTERQLTVVMVSHDLNLAALYGQTLLLLAGGQIAAQGGPSAVLTEALLATTYGCFLRVRPDPLTGRPQVALLPGKYVKDGVPG